MKVGGRNQLREDLRSGFSGWALINCCALNGENGEKFELKFEQWYQTLSIVAFEALLRLVLSPAVKIVTHNLQLREE